MIFHQRPGVYSDYDASSVTATGAAQRIVALIGASAVDAGVYTLSSYASAKETFGEESQLAKMLKLAYENGAGTVMVYPVANDSAQTYAAAVAAILQEKKANYLVLGAVSETVQTAAKAAVEAAAGQKGECIAFCGMGAATSAQLIARAEALNSERMVLLAPQVYLTGEDTLSDGCMAAAALAGALCASYDPAEPLNGQILRGLSGVGAIYDDTAYDALANAGVTVLECEGGEVSVIRALTTRTQTGGVSDLTYRELSTMRIIDEVIPTLRTALRSRFTRAKNNAVTRKAIYNQVVLELEDRVAREIIDGYDNLRVAADSTDRTVCVVEFEFTVVQGLSRIHLTAHVQV